MRNAAFYRPPRLYRCRIRSFPRVEKVSLFFEVQRTSTRVNTAYRPPITASIHQRSQTFIARQTPSPPTSIDWHAEDRCAHRRPPIAYKPTAAAPAQAHQGRVERLNPVDVEPFGSSTPGVMTGFSLSTLP